MRQYNIPKRHLLAALAIAAKPGEVEKAYLESVHVTARGELVATDGHVLFYSPPDTVDGPLEALTIPTTVRGFTPQAVRAGADVVCVEVDNEGFVGVGPTGLRCAAIVDPYPDVLKVMPQGEPETPPVRFVMQTRLLSRILEAFEGCFALHTASYGVHTPMVFSSDEWPGPIALLMQVNT